jgi:ketosteroid isomerase-like protein
MLGPANKTTDNRTGERAMEFAALLDEFTAAVEAGDGRRLAGLFTVDGVYHDTFYGAFQGRDAIADMLENRFWRDASAFRWDMIDPVRVGDVGYARWLFSYTAKVPEAAGRRVVFEGMGCFHMQGDHIRHYGEVFDASIALAQMSFAPERIAKIAARAAGALRERHAGGRHLAD